MFHSKYEPPANLSSVYFCELSLFILCSSLNWGRAEGDVCGTKKCFFFASRIFFLNQGNKIVKEVLISKAHPGLGFTVPLPPNT